MPDGHVWPSVAILTVSDRCARGEQQDKGGPEVAAQVSRLLGWAVTDTAIVPDEVEQISAKLRGWVGARVALVLTTGGTGFAPRDVTPEATRTVIEREAPGLMEAARAVGLQFTKHAMLSRAVAGMAGRTLIINLPGNPKAIREYLEVLAPVLPHAIEILTEAKTGEQGHRAV